LLKDSGMDAYSYGKLGASDELAVKAPQTPKETKNFFADNANAVVSKQLADLTFRIQTEISKARRKDQLSKTDLSLSDVIVTLNLIFSKYYSDNAGQTASIAVALGINRGRKDVFESFKDEIYGYQYSAILDTRTCPTCGKLDGKVLTQAEYDRTTYDPPIHSGCRCIWVAIMKDELDPPTFTGFDITEQLTAPSLSKDIEDQMIMLSERLAKEAVAAEVNNLLAED